MNPVVAPARPDQGQVRFDGKRLRPARDVGGGWKRDPVLWLVRLLVGF